MATRDKLVSARLTADEYAALQAFAEASEAPNVSTAARSLIVAGAGESARLAVIAGLCIRALCDLAGVDKSVGVAANDAAARGAMPDALNILQTLARRVQAMATATDVSAADVADMERAALSQAELISRDPRIKDEDRAQIRRNIERRDFARLAADATFSAHTIDVQRNVASGGGRLHDLGEARALREHEAAWREPTPKQADAEAEADKDSLP